MYPDYIMHFNPNHDPRNGQFAKGHGGSIVSSKKQPMPVQKKAAIAAGVTAAASVAVSIMRFKTADNIIKATTDGAFGAQPLDAIAPTIISAGYDAAKAALLVVASHNIKNYIKQRREAKKQGRK